MKGSALLLAAAFVAQSALAKPLIKQRSPFALKDAHFVPRRWTQVGHPDADHSIALRIGLKQGDFAQLERHLCMSILAPSRLLLVLCLAVLY